MIKWGIYIAIFLLALNGYGQVSFESSNLPIVIIDTHGASIPDEPKVTADMGIIDNGPNQRNNINDLLNDYDGKIGIELRGSSSQSFDKKNYGIELRDLQGNDTSISILGMPKESDWVLHGPYSDKSLMRNLLAFKLGRDLGWYASRTRLCELMVNNDYKGLYVFMEKIKRDNKRVDISKLKDDEISGDDLTGGYIIKIDKYNGGNNNSGWESPYAPPGKTKPEQVIFFQFEYPKAKNIVVQQKQYIEKFVTDFEETLKSPNFKDEHTGYRAFIDDNSFIDYAIINELSRNIDAYRLSTYLYKDKDSENPKMYIGPIWDYNLAFGNADYCKGSDTEGWAWDFNNVCSNDFYLIPFWWERFREDVQFIEKFKTRWSQLRQNQYSTDNIMHYIDTVVIVLDESQKRNFQRWQVLGKYIWPNNYVGNTYSDEINYLKTWITERLTWLDANIPKLETITALDGLEKDPVIFPNPFDHSVRLRVQSYSEDNISASIVDIMGRKVVTLKAKGEKDGRTELFWNGRDTAGKDMASGIYFVHIFKDKKLIGKEKIIKY